MPRADLATLLSNLPSDGPAEDRTPTRTAPDTAPPSPSPASYLTFERKEVRLRASQLEALTAHARRLNRAKRRPGPRITENTLIRIAVDLLLERVDAASGDSEAELLERLRA